MNASSGNKAPACNRDEPGSVSRIGPILALSYLFLPFLFFDLGWIRPVCSVPIAAASLVGFVLACRKMPALWVPRMTSANLAKAAACAALLGLWVWSSGIGGYVWGEVDHLARNTVFKMLVERSWPLYSANTPGFPPDTEPTLLSYYVGFFLPASLVGKAVSLRVGFFALWCWAFFGVCLAYYFVCARLRRILVWPVLVFVFFSGADSVGVVLRDLMHPGIIPFWSATSNFEQWSAYNYSCQTTQLYWVYNQAIPAWIATGLLLCGLPASCTLFLAAALMVNATFPFVAICFLSAVLAWTALPAGPAGESVGRKALRWARGFVSAPNVLGPLAVGIPSFLYLSGNTAGSRFGLGFHWTYPLFVFLEVVVPMVPLFVFMRKDFRYRAVGLALLLIPFGRVGFAHDFYSRTSISLLFVLLVWTVEGLDRAIRERRIGVVAAFLAVLALGAPTALHEMSRTFVRTRAIPDLPAYWRTHDAPESVIMQFKNPYVFTAPVAGNPFCKRLAKPMPETDDPPVQ